MGLAETIVMKEERREVNQMKIARSFMAALLLVGSLGASGAALAADGVLLREELAPGSDYGHLQFPAIREETLYWDQPVLKDPSEGDIIDFYGSVNHDPLGEDEIARQRRQLRQRESDND